MAGVDKNMSSYFSGTLALMAKHNWQQQLVEEGSSLRRCYNSFSLKATACRRSWLSHSSGRNSFRSSSDD